MPARTTWVYLGLVAWLAAVWLGLLGGCGEGVAGGGGSSTDSATGAASATGGVATTGTPATAGSSTTTTLVVVVSGPTTTLVQDPISLADLSAQIRGLLGDSGVPIYVPLALPSGYEVAASPSEGQAQGQTNPSGWRFEGGVSGPRAAGYAVLYTDGVHRIRLDVNPAGDLGDVQWADADTSGAYGPLRTTGAANTMWVGVPNLDGVEIIVSGDAALSEDLLLLASKVARVEGD